MLHVTDLRCSASGSYGLCRGSSACFCPICRYDRSTFSDIDRPAVLQCDDHPLHRQQRDPSICPESSAPSTRIPASVASQVDLNAADLATHFPSDLRGTMKANYVQSFGAFKQFERKLSLPDNDVATAISSYIAGNYMFLHGVELPDAAFLKVVAQVRHGLEESKGFPRIALQTRRKMYEQTAMVGMFMAVAQLSRKTATENPATVSNLQDSARANLAMVLGKSAANLRIDGEGMHF